MEVEEMSAAVILVHQLVDGQHIAIQWAYCTSTPNGLRRGGPAALLYVGMLLEELMIIPVEVLLDI